MALCPAMHAGVGLMLDEALREGASKWTGAGHSAVYLSGVCVASPVSLRLCEAGENGVVLTNYRTFGEDHSYEWNAIPLNVYLYGVEDESARPLYASPAARWMLQERYREKFLGTRCTGACATNPNALWRETVAASFIRDIYMFTAKTTTEQDSALIEKFNREGNVGHYHGMTYNCADFVAEVVNTYFPGAAKADHINDFGMTSPKAIAKSFAHYGTKHPELEFHVVRFSQIPGEYKSSRDNRKGTEELYRANRWRLPMAVLTPYELGVFASSYILTGKFNPELELQRRPTDEVIGLEVALRKARAEGDRQQEKQYKQRIRSARANALGTREEWSGYGFSLHRYEAEAVEQGYASDLDSLRKPDAADGLQQPDHDGCKRRPVAECARWPIAAESWIEREYPGGTGVGWKDGIPGGAGAGGRRAAQEAEGPGDAGILPQGLGPDGAAAGTGGSLCSRDAAGGNGRGHVAVRNRSHLER